jgi:hypothetical protein
MFTDALKEASLAHCRSSALHVIASFLLYITGLVVIALSPYHKHSRLKSWHGFFSHPFIIINLFIINWVNE